MNRRLRTAFAALLVASMCGALPVHATPKNAAVALPLERERALPNEFVFADKRECDKEHLDLLLNWSESERTCVVTTLETLCATNPKLVRNVLSIGPVFCYRLAEIQTFTAATVSDGILFNESFFRRNLNQRCDILRHEFVHWIDRACSVSYGGKWIRYAYPIISRVRCSWTLYGNKKNCWDSVADAGSVWRTFYATSDPQEALAESYVLAADRMSMELPITLQQLYLVDAIENVDPARREVSNLVHVGQAQYMAKDAIGAIRSFEAARRIAPRNPTVYGWLALSYSKNREDAGARAARREASKLFDQLGVHRFDSERRLFEFWRTPRENGGTKLGPYIRHLSAQPTDWYWLLGDGTCTRLAEAILYRRDKTGKLDTLLAYDGDPRFVGLQLDCYVLESKQAPTAVRLRAQWHEREGDMQTQVASAKTHYRLALKDCNWLAARADAGMHEHADVVRLLAKCGEVARARQLETQYRKADGDSEELAAARVAVLEAAGNVSGARAELWKMLRDIFASPDDDPPPVKKVFPPDIG